MKSQEKLEIRIEEKISEKKGENQEEEVVENIDQNKKEGCDCEECSDIRKRVDRDYEETQAAEEIQEFKEGEFTPAIEETFLEKQLNNKGGNKAKKWRYMKEREKGGNISSKNVHKKKVSNQPIANNSVSESDIVRRNSIINKSINIGEEAEQDNQKGTYTSQKMNQSQTSVFQNKGCGYCLRM